MWHGLLAPDPALEILQLELVDPSTSETTAAQRFYNELSNTVTKLLSDSVTFSIRVRREIWLLSRKTSFPFPSHRN